MEEQSITKLLEELIDKLEKEEVTETDTLSTNTVLEAIDHVIDENSQIEDYLTSLETDQLEKLKKEISNLSHDAITYLKNSNHDKEDVELASGELVSKSEVLEAIRRFKDTKGVLNEEHRMLVDGFWKQLEEYLKTRNISEARLNNIKADYYEDGCLTYDFKVKIKNCILSSLKEQQLNENIMKLADEVVEQELKQKMEDEENNFKNLIIQAPHPLRSQHLHKCKKPIIPLDHYDNTKEGFALFAKDYGLSEESINNLFSQGVNDETVGAIWEELENNRCILTNDPNMIQEIYRVLMNDLKYKVARVGSMSPKKVLTNIYQSLGFNEERTNTLLNNAMANGCPGKGFYSELRQNMLNQQTKLSNKYKREDPFKDVDMSTLSYMEKWKMRGKKLKHIYFSERSDEEKQAMKEDYRRMIQERQNAFSNLYQLNRTVQKETKAQTEKNINVNPYTFEIIDKKKINDAQRVKTKQMVQVATVASKKHDDKKILRTFLNRHVDKDIAIGDYINLDGELYPITAISVDSGSQEKMAIHEGTTIKELMEKLNMKSLKKGYFALAITVDGKYKWIDYTKPLNIVPKSAVMQQEQGLVM